MRGLFILCLVAAACADKQGYNYQTSEDSNEGISFTPARQADDDLTAQIPEASAPQSAVLAPEYQKEFYSFDAPEDSLDVNINEKIASVIKKSLRVVFIKAPENQGFEEAALSLAKQASKQQTAVYVLTKQPDIGALAEKLQNLKSKTQNQPEVHFVKYRTPEDADNAQKTIQEQYGSLPGASQNVNAGEAPVLNFASRSPVSAGHIPAGLGHQYLPANPISTKDYLPPSLRRFRL